MVGGSCGRLVVGGGRALDVPGKIFKVSCLSEVMVWQYHSWMTTSGGTGAVHGGVDDNEVNRWNSEGWLINVPAGRDGGYLRALADDMLQRGGCCQGGIVAETLNPIPTILHVFPECQRVGLVGRLTMWAQ